MFSVADGQYTAYKARLSLSVCHNVVYRKILLIRMMAIDVDNDDDFEALLL